MTFTRSLALAAICVLTLVPAAAPHDAPGSTTFEMPIPSNFMNSQILFVTLIGPPAGLEVLHTTWSLTFFSPAGGTPASEIHLEIGLPVNGAVTHWEITGAELGWPAANGTFSATLGSDQLNGVLDGGLLGGTFGDLSIFPTSGGVTGQFLDSKIVLELAETETCQADLGFGGPGSMSVSVCGDALAAGGSATLEVASAPASATAFLVLSTTATPVPFKGGTLVPVPVLAVLALPTDAAGGASLHVPGGGGPFTAYAQAAAPDGSQPKGYALSNALELSFLP